MWQQVEFVETPNWTRAEVLQRFWTHLRVETQFRTLLYYRLSSCDCWFEEVLGSTDNSTTLLWNDRTYPHYLRHRQDMDILAVACLRFAHYNEVLLSLSLMLDQILSVPVVLQLCKEEDPIEEQKSAWLLLKRSQELKMPNVLLLSWNFFTSRAFYAFDLFPKLKVTKLIYQGILTLFPYKLGNLQGHPIRTLPDNSQPHTIVRKMENGSFDISGPIWQFLIEFAQHINGSLQLPMEPVSAKTLRYVQVQDLVRNQTLDIAASLRPYSHVQRSNNHIFGYPLMVGNWCVMLPTERVITSHEAWIRLMESPWIWLFLLCLYILHTWLIHRIRVSYPTIHLIKPLAFLAIICFLQAQLSAYFIRPQQFSHITNMDEVVQAGLKIRGMRGEFMEYPIDMKSRYASTFLLHDFFFDLIKYRDSFNTSYGYTMTSIKWNLYKEAQRNFRRPLFRYSQDICIQKLSLFSLIMQSNCLYRYQIKQFLHRLHEAGLIRLWYRRSYDVMVKIGHFPYGDFNTSHQTHAIRWSEWLYVLAVFGIGLLFSTVVFVIELTVHYVNVYLQNL
ncbi:uncharacterized protein LOC119545715 [Drosophila subpulchrella]|uniref:uncharacterized protein LOC119545715 n=1 Tax=Drosophila subpulchrella TaxID=1486046 RepID=UPI0018A16B68|nr:uncharacterized protein LOC119545715 [Drosophila subpulchrella]